MNSVWAIVAATLVLTLPAVSADITSRPFGISMGQKLETLDRPKGKDTHYDLRSVPEPHPLLSRYSVKATKEAGVCEVSAYAPISEKGAYNVDEVARHLKEIFGEPQFFPGNRDPLSTGLWIWHTGAKKADVMLVALTRYERDSRSGAILTFQFSNKQNCEPKPTPNPFR